MRQWNGRNRQAVRARHKAYKTNKPDNYRNAYLKTRFGIGLAEYNTLLEKQGGVCAACKKAEDSRSPSGVGLKRLAVDHCHKTGKVRGLLCARCNTVVGQAREDMGILLALLDYLKQN